MSWRAPALVGLVVAPAIAAVALDQTGHRGTALVAMVLFLGIGAVVMVGAHLRNSTDVSDRHRRGDRARQRDYGRAFRTGRLPDDPSGDADLRRRAVAHRASMEQAPTSLYGGALAFGILNLGLGVARGRTSAIVLGAVLTVVMLSALALRPLAWRRLDRLDAVLDARAASARPAPTG